MNWNYNGLRKTATQLHGIVVTCVLALLFATAASACEPAGCVEVRAVNELGAKIATAEAQIILSGKNKPQRGKPEVRIKLMKKAVAGAPIIFAPEEFSPYAMDGRQLGITVVADGYVQWTGDIDYHTDKPNLIESKNLFTLRVRPTSANDKTVPGFTVTIEKLKPVADGSTYDGDGSRNGEIYLALSPTAAPKGRAHIELRDENGASLYKSTVTLSDAVQAYLHPDLTKSGASKSTK